MPSLKLRNIKTIAIRQLRALVEATPEPDSPIIGLGTGASQTLSARQILDQIEEGTELGQRMLEHWIALNTINTPSRQIKATPESPLTKG